MQKCITFWADPSQLGSAPKQYVHTFRDLQTRGYYCVATYLDGTLERVNNYDIAIVNEHKFDMLPYGESPCKIKTAFGDRRGIVFKTRRHAIIVDLYDDETLQHWRSK